ncbi:Uroporphyrinogen-III C-methyltransferase [Candida viswanathii]|uniref:uroporphyrinogen-III C-methyltransferase n=1 Tax=Candida viswanathii TaxID=5486 RepID=A0A367YP52_9ASCO|nr:Uroporphyrinogen-III C-methyltransferase [Candida viswanathii]
MTHLLTSIITTGETHLLFGYSNVTNLRIPSIVDSGARAVLFVESQPHFLPALQQLQQDGKLTVIVDPGFAGKIQEYLTSLGRSEVDHVVDRVFVSLSDLSVKQDIFNRCRRLRIPINTTDSPELCTFTMLSTYASGDFQFGVTTNGKGCKLALRIKREIINHLPNNMDEICDTIGELRKTIQEEDNLELESGEHEDDAVNTHKFNSFVPEFNQSKEDLKLQRTRWLSQIVEYYPLNKLNMISINDLSNAYKLHKQAQQEAPEPPLKKQSFKKGELTLVGSGPGSVSLLTLGALQAIHSADLVLADKLVPQQVLDLIPTTHGTKLFIARKFPGNAEKAQQELLSLGLEALNKGQKVVRLKQGDPYIFGRGGEEFNYFEQRGFKPVVIPGITSALAAPVLSNIPMTHRDVADQVLICTGTGRRGAVPNLPEFVPSRTTVFLMALHRVVELIPMLVEKKNWDVDLPCAIIERASCPDQRVIRTTLGKIAEAVESCGSRPPGLLVTGYACEVIWKKQTNAAWVIEEGCEFGNDSELQRIVELVNQDCKPKSIEDWTETRKQVTV